MTVFKKKCILPSQKVCHRLKNLRIAKKISLEEMEKCTKINKKYLEAIENCEFDKLDLPMIYQKNFIKKYLYCLKEEDNFLLQEFEEEQKKEIPNKKEDFLISKKRKNGLGDLPSILRYAFIFLILFSFVFYIWTNINKILTPPTLTIISPQDGIIVTENIINILGKTEKETKININKENIKINEQGIFDQQIILSPGINTVVISAESKHGKISNKTINIILK